MYLFAFPIHEAAMSMTIITKMYTSCMCDSKHASAHVFILRACACASACASGRKVLLQRVDAKEWTLYHCFPL